MKSATATTAMAITKVETINKKKQTNTHEIDTLAVIFFCVCLFPKIKEMANGRESF